MQIIKLNATDSTNAYLKSLLVTETLEDFTVVVADEQLKGRGQMGTVWESQKDKNLTFSVLKKLNHFGIDDKFLLNMCVSLAVYRVLKEQRVPDLSVKWPNDILSGSSKICGILIENIVNGNTISLSVLGIGLNVNQTDFENLARASSLRLILGKVFNLEELLHLILTALNALFLDLEKGENDTIKRTYERLLFRKDKPSTFETTTSGKTLMGFIRGVSNDGKLILELEDHVLKEFDLKEIRLLY